MSREGVSFSMSQEMQRTVEKIRGGFQLDSHINITQLSRSTAWRSNLEKLDVMQILDHNQTAAVLLAPNAYRALIHYISVIEEELQNTQHEILLKARENMNNWETGEELSRKAKESFLSRQEHLRGLLNGDSQ